MRTSWKGVLRGAALVAWLLIVGAPSAWGDDPPSAWVPLESRIKPPSGLTVQTRILPPSGVASQSRIKPPSGPPTSDARIKPPTGAPEPTLVELLLEWLRATARIHPQGG